MPSHQDRVRKNYSICFQRNYHNYLFMANTDIAPIINEDGTRTTIRVCFDCGDRTNYTRSQKQFEDELNKIVFPNIRTDSLVKLKNLVKELMDDA